MIRVFDVAVVIVLRVLYKMMNLTEKYFCVLTAPSTASQSLPLSLDFLFLRQNYAENRPYNSPKMASKCSTEEE